MAPGSTWCRQAARRHAISRGLLGEQVRAGRVQRGAARRVVEAPHIQVYDVCPTFVDTPGVDHAGNYTGPRLNLPPGALAPETVAKAVIRLATKPRNLTAVGAMAIAFKLGEFAAPNLLAAVMSGFLDVWSTRAQGSDDTDGTLFEAGAPAGAVDDRRDPNRGRKAALVVGGVTSMGLAGIGVWPSRRRR